MMDLKDYPDLKYDFFDNKYTTGYNKEMEHLNSAEAQFTYLSKVMGAQTRPLSLITLHVFRYYKEPVEDYDLIRILENARQGRRVPTSDSFKDCQVLEASGLCVSSEVDSFYRGTQRHTREFRLTKLGAASLQAYKAYENTLIEPFLENASSQMVDVLGEKGAERMAKVTLFTPLLDDMGLGNMADHVLENLDLLQKEYGQQRELYGIPSILGILKAQSIASNISKLFALSRENQLPESLRSVINRNYQIDEASNSQEMYRWNLIENDVTGTVGITPLGEDSLRAFNTYYLVLEQPLQEALQSR